MNKNTNQIKYLTVSGVFGGTGFNTTLSNLLELLAYAAIKGCKLVVPKFNLGGYHNNGRSVTTDLSEYLDYSTLHIDGKLYEVAFELPANVAKAQVQHLDCSNYQGMVAFVPAVSKVIKAYGDRPDRAIEFHPDILAVSRRVRSELGDEYAVIHIRGRDKVPGMWRLGPSSFWGGIAYAVFALFHWERHRQSLPFKRAVSKNKIITALDKLTAELQQKPTVYLMTDEPLYVFRKLLDNRKYRVLTYADFDELKQLKARDNYKLFCVERALCHDAKVQIASRVDGSNAGAYSLQAPKYNNTGKPPPNTLKTYRKIITGFLRRLVWNRYIRKIAVPPLRLARRIVFRLR